MKFSRFFKMSPAASEAASINFLLVIGGLVPVPVLLLGCIGVRNAFDNYVEKRHDFMRREDELLEQGFKKIPVDAKADKLTFVPFRPNFGVFALIQALKRDNYVWRNAQGDAPPSKKVKA